MRKLLHTFFFLSFLLISFQSKAQITIGTVDAGPYGYGSNITVPLSFPGNVSDLPIGNTFELYLSDATGNFAGNGTLLGTFGGFYTPAVNGVIPNGLAAGNGYKLRIRTSNPNNTPVTNTIDVPGNITIVAQTSPTVTLTPNSSANALGGDNIGFCPTDAGNNKSLLLKDNVPSSTSIEVQVRNLITNAVTSYNETLLPAGYNLTNLNVGFYSVTSIATTVVNGIAVKSIKNYVLHNTTFGIGITDNGATAGCIDGIGGGAVVSYSITGITSNYPGTTYRVNWGDGTNVELTLSQINNNGGSITHSFTETSCGKGGAPDGSNNNSFQVTITSVSVTCGVTKPVTAYAQVFLNPVAKITGNGIGCINTLQTFTNASLAGTRSDCTDQMDYTWYVDGGTNPVQISTTNEPLVWTFTTAGNHTVRLVASNGVGVCDPSEFTFRVCIQELPRPSFTLPGTAPVTICAGTTLTPTNTSFIDNGCTPDRNFRWIVDIVTAGGPVTFVSTSETPQFAFPTAGVYDISLAIPTAACGEVISAKQRVVVNTLPTATLSQDTKLCIKGYHKFNEEPSATQAFLTGTFNDLPTTYLWEVTGGSYTFVEGTTPTSKYPHISFNDFGVYTIKVTHTNTCGTVTDTQVITFTEAPTIDLGPTQTICFKDNAALNPVVTGNLINPTWTGGAGTYNVTNGVGTYTPTAQEKAAGTVTLTYSGTTEVEAPCNVISAQLIINIKPQIIINSAATARVCTATAANPNNPLNYQPTATTANTTYSWTASGTPNAGGFNNSATASETGPIVDNLTNSDPTADATVTYMITPKTSDGCVGDPFTLVVTVTPRPIITATGPTPAICSGSASGITMTSNLPGTTYTWTSTATAGITGSSNNTTPTTVGTISQTLTNSTRVQGAVTYTITSTSTNNCPGTPFDITVLVDPTVTQAIAGPNATESICELTEYTLQANAPGATETGLWTLVSGPNTATFVDATLNNTKITNLTPGSTYVLEWKITGSGTCPATTSRITIIVNTPTVAGTTTTADLTTVCSGTNAGTITLSGNVGAVIYWQSSIDNGVNWVNIANTSTSLSYTNITTATQYRAVVQNGSCDIRFSTATPIAVTPATTIAAAGADQKLCAELSTVLTGNTPATGETGLWQRISGPATITINNPAGPQTTVTGLTAGATYVFRWTINGQSPCGPTIDELTVINHLPLTNTINSSSTEVCNGKIITIVGDLPTGGDGVYNYVWEVSTDGTTWSVIPAQTSKDLNYQMLTTSSFRRTVTSSTCTLVSNVIRIIAQPPIANNSVAASQTICTGVTPAPLTGTLPTGSDGNFSYQWQLSENNGASWANIVAAVGQNYIPPSLTTTTLYRRVVSTNACDGDLRNFSAPITITVKPDAKAEYTFTTDKACTPFVIDANNIKAVAYPDRNASYTWYANGVQIGTSITFPGYTISNSDQSVTIKLVTAPSQGCKPSEFEHVFSTNQSVAASFTQSATEGCSPLVVNFVNTSTSLTNATFRWDFGNGTTSTQTMPGSVTFLEDPTGKDTTYTVTLTAITTCGSTSITSKVFVKALPRAIFSPSKTTGCSPMTVTFSNTSPGGTNTYYYDFGDGTLLTKTDKSSVQHTFITNVVRDFVVKMVAQNDCGRDERSYTIRVAPNTVLPELVVNANEKEGCAPFLVNFYNNSRGANLFKYDFGDGSTLLTRSAPEVVQHTFTRPGTYTIVLTASNGCSDTTTTESITVLPQPLAAFSADNTLGCPGLVVKFKNTTTDGVSYLWDFGDGTTSIEFEPQHVFNADKEYYTISLTATNALGCTYTAILNQYIHIVAPPVAKFNVAPSTLISIPNYTFRFEDESTNTPTIWLWDFGDKTTSALQNPSHTYLDTGTYVVTLRVSNQQGCFTTTFKSVTIVGVPGYLYVPNSFMPGSETPELRTFIAKGSGIKSWTFSVFNKWGQTLWQTTKLDEGRPVEGWDGMFNGVLQPQGVYFWKIDVDFINGTGWKGMTYDSSAPKKTGVIHLIR